MRRARRIKPVLCVWDGEAFRPVPRFKSLCDRQFTVGEEYALAPDEERNMASHNAFMASVEEGWANLPEDVQRRFPTATHLRRWALIQCGFCTQKDYACESPADARQLAAAIRSRDEYCVIKVGRDVVQVFDALSQSKPAMKAEIFEQSKREVLDLIATMAKTTATQLKKEGRHHGR